MAANISDPQSALKSILAAISEGADHFGILQLPPAAGPSEIRDAYFRLAKVVHPDLPAFIADPKLRLDATRAFQAITLAHATLSDPTKRLAYTSGVEHAKQNRLVEGMSAPMPAATSPSGRHEIVTAETAKIYYARGKGAAQRRDWQVAQDALQLSLKFLTDSELVDAQLNLAWCMINNPQAAELDKVTRSKDMLFNVIAAQPKSMLAAQAHYYLGIWNKFHGDMREAAKHFDGCLQLDPRHIEAKREKMILERRRGPDPVKGSKPSRANIPAAGSTGNQGKVGLEKKQSFFERLFGGKKG